MTTIGQQGRILPEDNILSQEELDALIEAGKFHETFSQDEIRSMLVENTEESLEDVKENVMGGVPLSREQLEMLIRKNNLPKELREELPGVFRDRYEEEIADPLALYATGIRRTNARITDRARLLDGSPGIDPSESAPMGVDR